MRMRLTLSLAGLVILAISATASAALPAIRVSDNGHYFVKEDGTPFFWQGDTAWGIFNHPSPADVDIYLDDRASKGFNVIQGVIALWDYTMRKNPDGELPFVDRDLGKINEVFYKNVDSIVDKVEAHGMYMAMLPYWHKNAGDRLAADGNPEKLQAYCKFLAKRYAKRNIFWVLGGDSTAAGPTGPEIQHITDLEAQGLIDGAKEAGVDKIMISYHPTGRQSASFWFQARPWLDFDSIQSGHFINTTNFQMIAADYAKTPTKPTLDMEPGYENITNGLVRTTPTATRPVTRIEAVDVRRSAYLAVFAGAAGHTYGNGEVYEFWSPGGTAGRAMPGWSAQLPWKESLKLPASSQEQFIRFLILSREPLLRMPDQSLIVGPNSNRAVEHFGAMRGSDGSFAFVYFPAGKTTVTINTGKLSGTTLTTRWYNPRTGEATRGENIPKADTQVFTVPAATPTSDGNDWVLVLDDASKNFAAPGTH